MYAEVPDWLTSRLRREPIQPASFGRSVADENTGVITPSPEPAAPPRHAIRLADGARTTSGCDFPAEREDAAFDTVLTGATPPGVSSSPACPEDPLSSSPRPTGERSGEGRVRGDATSTPAILEPELCDPQRAISSGSSLELAVSITSVTESFVQNREGRTAVAALARLASRRSCFARPTAGFVAQVPVGERLEIYGLRSAGFRDWLIDGYLADQPEPPSSWAIRRVVGMLEARATI